MQLMIQQAISSDNGRFGAREDQVFVVKLSSKVLGAVRCWERFASRSMVDAIEVRRVRLDQCCVRCTPFAICITASRIIACRTQAPVSTNAQDKE